MRKNIYCSTGEYTYLHVASYTHFQRYQYTSLRRGLFGAISPRVDALRQTYCWLQPSHTQHWWSTTTLPAIQTLCNVMQTARLFWNGQTDHAELWRREMGRTTITDSYLWHNWKQFLTLCLNNYFDTTIPWITSIDNFNFPRGKYARTIDL